MLRMYYIDLPEDYSNLTDEELNRLIEEDKENIKLMTEWEDPDKQ